MRKTKYVPRLLLLMVFFVSFSAFSKISKERGNITRVTIDKAVQLAISKSEDVAIRDNEKQKMQYRYDEVKSAIYPHLNAEIGWDYYPQIPQSSMSLGSLGTITTDLKDKYETSASITATQVLWSFGRVYSAIRFAQQAFEISQINYESSRKNIIYGAKVAYYSVLMAQKSMEIAKSSYLNAKRNQSLLHERFSSGRPPKKDNIKMAADVAARIPRLKNAESEFELSKRRLKMILGIDELERIQLTQGFRTQFPALYRNELESSMIKSVSVLKMLRKRIKLSSELVKIKKADFLPTLSAYGSYRYSGGSKDVFPSSNEFQKTGVVGIKLDIPIFNGGEKIGRYRQAVIEKSSDQIQLRKALKGITLELRNSLSEYSSLIKIYEANQEAQRLASKSYLLTQTRFRSGKSEITELNDRELMLSSLKLNKELTLFKINTLLVKIEKLASIEGKL